MKNLKKVLAFVIVFTMMLGLSVSASIFPDVDDNASYAEAVTILDSLGIMYGDDNGNFRPEDTITRAEVATVVVRALGLEDAAAGAKGATQFNDVAADHWATGYINLATQKGIIAGYGDGTFGPEDPVTYEQVTKMIVAALGYTPKADNNGGYPTGYLVIASQEGIAKGAAGSNGEPAKRSTVARLVFNALEVNLMEQTGFKVGEPEYEVVDKTLLSSCLDVEKWEGVVSSTYLVEGDKESKNIEITYDVKNDKAEDFVEGENVDAVSLLGMTVTAYVQEDEVTGDDTIIAIAPKANKNTVLTLDYTQLENYDAEDGIVKYALNKKDKTKEIEIAEKVVKHYNGMPEDSSKKAETWLKAKADVRKPGFVTFVNNGTDDYFDYIMVYEYTKNVVVSEIDTAKNRLESEDGTIRDIDIDDEDAITFFYNADGSAAAFEDIEVGNTLTIINNTPLVMVWISTTVIEGTVDEETEEDGETVYTISGSEYKAVADGIAELGDEGTFYINIDNRIVAADTTSAAASDKYAYAYAVDVDGGISGTVAQVQFLAADGTWKVLDFAKKVTVYKDGKGAPVTVVPAKDGETSDLGIMTVTKTKGEPSATLVADTEARLFQYDVNSAGAINKLYVKGTAKNVDKVFTMDYTREDAAYSAKNDKVGAIYLGENTLVYSVPERGTSAVEEDEIKLVNKSAIFQDGTEYDIDVYDNDDDEPAVIIVYGAESGIDVMSQILLVTGVSTIANDEGVTVQKIYGLQSGEEVVGYTSEDGAIEVDADGKAITEKDKDGKDVLVAATIEAGDIIIFSQDAAGAIEKVYTIADLSDIKKLVADNGSFDFSADEEEITRDVFGFVAENKKGRIVLKDADGFVVDENGDNVTLSLSKANVYSVDLNKAKPVYDVASASDVVAEDRVGWDGNWLYVHMYDDVVIDAVIYSMELE